MELRTKEPNSSLNMNMVPSGDDQNQKEKERYRLSALNVPKKN